MPRHAPALECSAEDKARLLAITKSGTAEARAVERARIILACLEGKEIQQVAQELGVSIPTVTKWRKRFALWGLRGLRDQFRPGKLLVAAGDGAIMAGPVGTTPPMLDGGEWTRLLAEAHTAARAGA
jgi:hypothetical protein